MPLVGKSRYTEEFPPKYPTLPNIRPSKNQVTEGQIRKSSGTFDGRTTYKEQHKNWLPNPSLTFGELPTFADSIIYPEKKQYKVPEPTTRATFQGRPGKKADLCERAEANIKYEGR